jgi:hypothetical protein
MVNILPLSPGLGQGKLTMLRCKNRKIRHENEILKQTNGSIKCRNLRSIKWYKKICSNPVRLSIYRNRCYGYSEENHSNGYKVATLGFYSGHE